MKSKLTKLTLSIILTLTIISLAVVLTLACKPLYYLDIHALHIPETTGCTISEIKANYNAVIDYCLSFGNAPLKFPTFPMSEGGRIHFEEVKNIFNLFKYMVIGGTLASTAGILWMRRKHCYGYLKLTAILTVALPAIIGAAVALNWDGLLLLSMRLLSTMITGFLTRLPDRLSISCRTCISCIAL